MGTFANVFKSLRTSRNYTQEELSKLLNITRSSLGMYETGKREPDYETLEKIADFFNVDMDYLLGRTNKTTYIPGAHRSTAHTIRVLGRVAAGIPIDSIQETIDQEEISDELYRTGTFFGLRIKGDSMAPRIQDGDTVIVRAQDDAESDQIVIAFINGHDGVCKKLKKLDNGLMLVSLNPSYEPMVFTKGEIDVMPVKIIGRVIEVRGKL